MYNRYIELVKGKHLKSFKVIRKTIKYKFVMAANEEEAVQIAKEALEVTWMFADEVHEYETGCV